MIAPRLVAQAACLALASLAMGAMAQEPGSQPAAQADPGGELSAITVTATTVDDGTTEGTGTYKATATSTATKLNLSPRETPQTVTTITRQQMDDAGITSVHEAIKATSGVTAVSYGMEGNQYYSRGFTLQYQMDGMSAPGGVGNRYSGGPPVDTAFIDRMEVVQGASGLTTGAGDPGGTINLVRKRPTASFQARAEAQLSSWSGRRVVGDISGPLAASGRLRGRLVAVVDRSNSSVDHAFVHRHGVYGIVEADLTPDTLMDASLQYQKDTGRYHLGVPLGTQNTDLGFSRSAYFGDANSQDMKELTNLTLGLTQRLGGDWNLKARYSHQDAMTKWRNYSYLNASLNEANGSVLPLAHRPYFQWGKKSNVMDVSATGPVELFGRKHELALGLNGSRYHDENHGSDYAVRPVDVFAFDPTGLDAITPTSFMTNTPVTDSVTTNLGMFGVARWSLADPLKLITGVRWSRYKVENRRTGAVQPKESGVVTPYAGLIYDINAQYSAYVSYSDIFSPSSRRSIDGGFLDPVVGSNYEAGIKGELLDKRLNVSAAVFRLNQKNLSQTDPDNPTNPLCGGTCYVAVGKVRSQGVDLGANGQITQGLNFSASYTYVKSEYVEGANKGLRYSTLQPKNSLRLALNYKVPNTGWSIGGNVTANSKSYVTSGAKTATQGGYMLLGLNARYQLTPKTQVNLAVSNVTDRRYFVLYSDRYAPFGEPRKFALNLKHDF